MKTSHLVIGAVVLGGVALVWYMHSKSDTTTRPQATAPAGNGTLTAIGQGFGIVSQASTIFSNVTAAIDNLSDS